MPAKPKLHLDNPSTDVLVGDCREVLHKLPAGSVDLVFADPPFNWDVKYGEWDDKRPRQEYVQFTHELLDACIRVLADQGALWVNIPDDAAAEIVMHLKSRGLHMINWCIWHLRFGQNRSGNFLVSKVHALYFAKDKNNRCWNPDAVLEPSDRAAVYDDQRTFNKKRGENGLRVPLDVWYGLHWGRVQ